MVIDYVDNLIICYFNENDKNLICKKTLGLLFDQFLKDNGLQHALCQMKK